MSEFLGVKNREGKLIRKYEQLIKGKTNEEKREIELQLLKPDVLPPYTGPKVNRGPLGKRTVKFFFPSNSDVELLAHHVKINNYVELNTYDTDLIMRFVELLEEGTLRYDKNIKRIIFVNDRGDEFPL